MFSLNLKILNQDKHLFHSSVNSNFPPSAAEGISIPYINMHPLLAILLFSRVYKILIELTTLVNRKTQFIPNLRVGLKRLTEWVGTGINRFSIFQTYLLLVFLLMIIKVGWGLVPVDV